jgi:hypothetical protein
MSSIPLSSSASSRIDDQLRLQIADDLAGQFKGEIIGPDHPGYESARLVWNAMIDRRPGLGAYADTAGAGVGMAGIVGLGSPSARRRIAFRVAATALR